ncbi:MAG: BTAD domain-containing putative transcriptional regulator [Hyphomicrobiales bacterium]
MLDRRAGEPKPRSKRSGRDPADGRATLSISIIGPFSASCGKRAIKFKTRKAGAVLAYLALSETKQENRERLVGFLWSLSEEAKARTSLRQILYDMRRALSKAGFDGLQTGKLTVALDGANVDVDLLQVIAQADAFRAHPLLLHTPQLTDRLFEGLEDLDPSFRVWIRAKRQTIQDRLLRSLNAGLASRDVRPAIKQELAAAILNLDPTHEEACRYAMEARAVAGDVAGAVRLYKSLWDLLDEEYGMEPSPETQVLVARIKLGEFERQAEQRTSEGIDEESSPQASAFPPTPRRALQMALLLAPFEMNGVGPDKLHLVSGFRHHLAACLVRFREWSVVDNSSALIHSPPGSSAAAEYTLDATAYQAGSTINMVLTLHQTAEGLYVWSDSFELTLETWFEAQQRVIRGLTSSLNVQLSTERLKRLAAQPDVSLETYDRWLRGHVLILRFDPDSWKRAETIFADATRDSPDFSPLHSSIVQMANTEHFAFPGLIRALAKAKATVERAKLAVQLDPVDSRAHLCLGWAHAFAHDYDEAAPHMEMARELNSNDPVTLASSAAYWAFCGDAEKSVALAREAMLLAFSPAPIHWAYYAFAHFLHGDWNSALQATERAQDLGSTVPAWRAAALFHLGRREEAASEGRRFLNNIRSRWFGSERPSDLAIARWVLQAHPIRWRAQWELLRDGIRGASIPTHGIEHGVW